MERIVFNDYEELADYMYTRAHSGRNITSTLFFNDTVQLMKQLLSYDGIDIGGIDIAQDAYGGYSKEYYVTLCADMVLDVEPAYNGHMYLRSGADIMLIHGDACSAIIKTMDDDVCREIYIGSDTDSDDSEWHGSGNDDVWNLMFDNTKIIKSKNNDPIEMSIDIESILKAIFDK